MKRRSEQWKTTKLEETDMEIGRLKANTKSEPSMTAEPDCDLTNIDDTQISHGALLNACGSQWLVWYGKPELGSVLRSVNDWLNLS